MSQQQQRICMNSASAALFKEKRASGQRLSEGARAKHVMPSFARVLIIVGTMRPSAGPPFLCCPVPSWQDQFYCPCLMKLRLKWRRRGGRKESGGDGVSLAFSRSFSCAATYDKKEGVEKAPVVKFGRFNLDRRALDSMEAGDRERGLERNISTYTGMALNSYLLSLPLSFCICGAHIRFC